MLKWREKKRGADAPPRREVRGLSDYERYGEYNRGEDEEPEGPPPHRFFHLLGKSLSILCIAIIVVVFAVIGFRLIVAGYSPREMKQLTHTDALTAYAAALGGDPYVETQEIRVPFESEYLEAESLETTHLAESQNGWFYADHLLLVRDAGALQCSLRMNSHAAEEIAAQYGVPDFAIAETAFRFTLIDNLGRTYRPSVVSTDSALWYRYYKLCFDGVDFEGVSWMRLEIEVAGADMTVAEHPVLVICVYENHETYATFKEYSLSRKERF